MSTTRKRALPDATRAYASATLASGSVLIIGRRPARALNRSVPSESIAVPDIPEQDVPSGTIPSDGADDRAAKGFTVGQVFFSPNGLLNRSYDSPDLEEIRNAEAMIAYANKRGITVWIHPWWSGERLNERVSEEQIRRWWRYVIARLGAYNVIWTLAGEYNMNNYGGFGLPFWKDLGAMVKHEDSYRRMVSAHPTPPGWSGGADAPQ